MRRRLVLLSVATTTMVVLAFLIPLAVLVGDLAENRAVSPAQQAAQALAPLAALGAPASIEAAVEAAHARFDGPVGVRAPDGRVYGDLPDEDVPTSASVVLAHDGGRIVVVPVVSDIGTGVVAIGVPVEAVRRGVGAARLVLGGLGVLLVVAAAVVADRLARSTTEAIEDVEDTARRLSAGDLGARTTAHDPPEVMRVARALDLLADRITDLLADEREAVADLSHRLRTPLTALRLDLEALPASAERDVVQADLDALDAAVNRAIDEARRPGRGGATRRCDLVEVVGDRVAWWTALAEDEHRVLEARLAPGPAWVAVGRQDAEAVVDSLLGNVFAHTPPGTAALVELEQSDGTWLLRVGDDGPGFPDGVDVLARGVSGGGSTGLGLDIVVRTTRAAGGSVEVGSGAAGGDAAGAVVTCRLPSAAGPA